MTMNEPPNQLEWFIRARSGVDSGQWDWGIKVETLPVCSIVPVQFQIHIRLVSPIQAGLPK